MHGVTMIFLYALPMLSGFSNYLWPLMLGSRDMAFPRLNALSYWIFLFAGIFLYASFPLGAGAERRLVQLRAVRERSTSTRASTSTSTRSAWCFLGISTTVGVDQFHRHAVSHARARHVDQPRADPGLGHADRLGRATFSRCRRSASPSSCCGWTGSSARISSMSPAAASRCSGSTCSGCSATPGSTRSCCRRWASCPTACRRSAAGRWSATRAVALATVTTMVLGFGVWVHHMFATGLPPLALSFFSAASIVIVDPERGRGVRLDRDDLDRHGRSFTTAVPVLRRLRDRAVRDRRRVGLHDRGRAGRLAAHRHLLRRRAPALRADRHQRVPGGRRHLLLVPEDAPAG